MANCLNVSENLTQPAKFNITGECALFDFSVLTVTVGVLCLLGLVGNIVSFTVLWRDQGKTATAFLLRAMTVADCLVLLAALPLYAGPAVFPFTGYLKGYHELFYNLVPFLWPAFLIPYTGTILLTVLVSLNRYMAVCKPFKSGTMCSPDRAHRHVICIALFSVIYNIPRFFEYSKVEVCVAVNESKEGFEISAFGSNRYYRVIYSNVLYFLIMHGGPLISLAFLNVKLIKALKERAERRQKMVKGAYQQDITFSLIVVVFVFMTCQTPTFVDHILWTFLDEESRTCGNWHYYYTAIGDMLAVVNSSVNFVVYVLTNKKFRHSLIMSCTANKGSCFQTDEPRNNDMALLPKGGQQNPQENHGNDDREEQPLQPSFVQNKHVND